MRAIKILSTRIRKLSIVEIFQLIQNTLFFDKIISVYCYDIIKNVDTNNKNYINLLIRKGDLSYLDRINKNLIEIPWEFQCHLFDNVKDFFVVIDDNGIQHISWLYYRNHHNRILELKDKEAEIKFCLTIPSARGFGIYPQVLIKIIQYLKNNSFERVYICAFNDNYSSIRGIEKVGFKKINQFKFKKIFGIQVSSKFVPKW